MKSAKANRGLALARLGVNWKHSARPYRSCTRGAMFSQNKLAVKCEVVVRSRNPYSSPHVLLESVHLSAISHGWSSAVLIFKEERCWFCRLSRGHALRFECKLLEVYTVVACSCTKAVWTENPNHALITKSRHFWGKMKWHVNIMITAND